LPDGLAISPHHYMSWDHNEALDVSHAATSEPRRDTVEIWETRAIVRTDFATVNPSLPPDRLTTVRALWQDNVCADVADDLPSAGDREQIVDLSSAFDLIRDDVVGDYIPTPLKCKDLRLSPIGGSLDVKAEWPCENVRRRGPSSSVYTVRGYQHQIKQGRDQFAEVVRVYKSCFSGHLVYLIRQRERRFIPVHRGSLSGTGAVVVETWYSKHEPLPAFQSPADSEHVLGRRWPFTRIDLDWPDKLELKAPVDIAPAYALDGPAACWMYPKCGSEPLPIDMTAWDLQGRVHKFSAPLLLIDYNIAKLGGAPLQEILRLYAAETSLRRVSMRGQKLGLVKSATTQNADGEKRSAFATRSMIVGVDLEHANLIPDFRGEEASEDLRPDRFPPSWNNTKFYPAITDLDLHLREIETYSRSSSPVYTTLKWNSVYNAFGFNASDMTVADAVRNHGELFLDCVDAAPSLAFAPERSGGLATPSADVAHYSRMIGAVGAVARRGTPAAVGTTSKFLNGEFDPSEFFNLDAKLIGDISLSDVLRIIPGASEELSRVPKLLSEEFADVQAALQEIAELVQLVNDLRQALVDFPADITAAVERISQDAINAVGRLAATPLRAFVQPLLTDLVTSRDIGFVKTMSETLAILLQAIRNQYASPDNARLDELADALSLDRLTRAVQSSLNTALDVFGRPAFFDVLGPIQSLRRIVESATDPDRFVDGSLAKELAELRVQLNGGVAALASAANAGFARAIASWQSTFQSILDQLALEVESVLRARTETNRPGVRNLVTANFPLAIDPLREPEAAMRLDAFEDYLDRAVNQGWFAATNQIISDASLYFSRVMADPGIVTLLSEIDRALVVVAEAVSTVLEAIEFAISNLPCNFSVKYDWNTELQSGPATFPIFVASGLYNGRQARLSLNTKIDKKLGLRSSTLATPPQFNVSLSLTDFQLVLIPNLEFVTVGFSSLAIESRGTERPSVSTRLEGIEFGDALTFIQQIAELFSTGSGFYSDISAGGVSAGYRFQVPDFTVGAFNLADLRIGVGVALPFDGSPLELELKLSEREQPCILTVGLFGGTAYFGLRLSPRHSGTSVQSLEAQLEFGAIIKASLGPAVGRLKVVGRLSYGRQGDCVTFGGYVIAQGSLDVLGLITVEAVFHLGLTYRRMNGGTEVFGEVSISIRVKILYVINTRVTVYFRKQFQGSPPPDRRKLAEKSPAPFMPLMLIGERNNPPWAASPPPRVDRHVAINTDAWADYCRQFA
jgi:hypothetical protein